jgi:hypothetical protein
MAIKPSALPIWTQGNTGARTQPTDGEQFAGFVQNQRPDPTWHNWLWGIMSDWIEWFDFICDDPSNFPVSNAGHNVAISTNLQGQLDELDAVFGSFGLIVIPTVIANGTQTNFALSQAPINTNSVVPTLDGSQSQPSEFTVQNISGTWYIVFGTAPSAGQDVSGFFVTGSSGAGVGGGVGAIENAPGGVGIFWKNNINVALLKSLVAGTNVSIVDNGDGTITISSTGGGGGSIETHGTAAAPIAIDPTVGIIPTTASEQVWWVKPSTGSGAVPITASPAIGAGTSLGQRLKLKSTAVLGGAGYLVIPNLSGTDMNGSINMGSFAQAIDYTWDGTNWSEDSRRV